MAELKVIWTNRALAVFQKTAYWYAANLGIQFAATFAKNVDEAIHKILLMPTVGQLEKRGKDKKYRSILSHLLCRIYYWYNNTEIHIVWLRFNKMNK